MGEDNSRNCRELAFADGSVDDGIHLDADGYVVARIKGDRRHLKQGSRDEILKLSRNPFVERVHVTMCERVVGDVVMLEKFI